jgi:hypothetical protein
MLGGALTEHEVLSESDPSDRGASFPGGMRFAYMEIEILAHLTSQTEQTGTHLAGMPFLNGTVCA